MAIKKVFKSYIPFINFVTSSGRTCVFQEGRYLTDHPEEVAELSAEIKRGNVPHLHIDPQEVEVDTSLQEAIREAQAKAALEVLAKHNQEKGAAANTNQTGTQAGVQGAQTGAQSMSPATLLGLTNSATLMGGGAVAQSNGK